MHQTPFCERARLIYEVSNMICNSDDNITNNAVCVCDFIQLWGD